MAINQFPPASGGGGSGTVTSVATGSGLSGGPITTTGTINLAASYGDTINPYASKTANYFLAAPNGSAGAPTFRAVVAADIPTLNQSTTGNATTATNINAGATNQIPFQSAASTTSFIAAPTTASTYLGWNGSAFTWGAVSATVNWAVPGAIGSTTPNLGYFSSLSFSDANTTGGVNFNGGTGYLSSYIGVTDKTANASGKTTAFVRNMVYDPDYGAGNWVYQADGAASRIEFQEDGSIILAPCPPGIGGDLAASGLYAFSTTTLSTYNGVSILSDAYIKSSSASAGVGYATGAGSTQTQSTSKSTAVTLNKICGKIQMAASSLAASTSVSFTFTNSTIDATDVVIVNASNVGGSSPTANTYMVTVDSVLSGSCRIHVRNVSASAAAQALVLNFAVIKAVAA